MMADVSDFHGTAAFYRCEGAAFPRARLAEQGQWNAIPEANGDQLTSAPKTENGVRIGHLEKPF